jgi:hypothetical protein
MRLTVSEIVVQWFAGVTALLIMAGVIVVLAVGSRSGRSRPPSRPRDAVDPGAMTFSAELGAVHRNGTSRHARDRSV